MWSHPGKRKSDVPLPTAPPPPSPALSSATQWSLGEQSELWKHKYSYNIKTFKSAASMFWQLPALISHQRFPSSTNNQHPVSVMFGLCFTTLCNWGKEGKRKKMYKQKMLAHNSNFEQWVCLSTYRPSKVATRWIPFMATHTPMFVCNIYSTMIFVV